MSWHSLSRVLGKHDNHNCSNVTGKACELERLHEKCHEKFNDYSNTVVRPFDGYLMLASHILWDAWKATGNDVYLWRAVVPLHKALKDSPASFQLRFLLIKFLNAVGAVGLSYNVHAGLELKHVQWDSLGYLLSRHIQTCSHFESTMAIFHSVLKFFSSNYKEVSKGIDLYTGFLLMRHHF